MVSIGWISKVLFVFVAKFYERPRIKITRTVVSREKTA
jgi:hypothetical protein